MRRLGAASADVVECIADGAEWIWKRVGRLRTLAEIPASKVVEVLDFYQASQYLSETIATCRHIPKTQRQALYKGLRHALRYGTLEAHKLPIGSGQVESAVRQVVNLRFKAPGSFWRETTVSCLMHLRAACKAGRWDEVMRGVLTGTFQAPSFEPVDNAAPQRPAAVREYETSQTFVSPRKKAA